MASPLGLTDFNGIKYTSDNGDTSSSTFDGRYNSVFNGSKFYYRPSIGTNEDPSPTAASNATSNAKGTKRHQPDNSSDDLYDISTNSIIDYTSAPELKSMKLKPSDFAFLADMGVYPNNRLLIGRRFASPVENDLTAVKFAPMSTVVSWIPDTADQFFSFKSSEKWQTEQEADPLGKLTDVFNDVFLKSTNIDIKKQGDGLIGGLTSMLPIGGVGEALQTTLRNYLLGEDGKPGTNFSYDNMPMGNPNFMGESSYRDMNSITSTITIPFKTVYEMKYIPGVDPTLLFMDVIQNLLRFSSSQSVFYLSQTGGGKINEFFNKFKEGKWIDAIQVILDGIVNAVKEIANDIGSIVSQLASAAGDLLDGNTTSVSSEIQSGLSKISASSFARYRIEFAKIMSAATGASSAPWHITMGNPKNPFFSSGDMIAENCEIKFGNTLGFNDLPTRIEYSFNMKSARNLGIQEIFDKFNIGAGRQYQRNAIKFQTDFYQGTVNGTNKNGDQANPISGAVNTNNSNI